MSESSEKEVFCTGEGEEAHSGAVGQVCEKRKGSEWISP